MSGNLNLTSKQILRSVQTKLKLQNVRQTRETYGDFYLDGKFQFRVTMPNDHGNKTLSTGFLKQCRDTTFLNSQQYAELVRCTLDGDDYEDIIRAIIVARSDKAD